MRVSSIERFVHAKDNTCESHTNTVRLALIKICGRNVISVMTVGQHRVSSSKFSTIKFLPSSDRSFAEEEGGFSEESGDRSKSEEELTGGTSGCFGRSSWEFEVGSTAGGAGIREL